MTPALDELHADSVRFTDMHVNSFCTPTRASLMTGHLEGRGFNAGMRGRKASVYDGGHRVPCFFHWAKVGMTGGRDAVNLAAGYDILLTLIELCGMNEPDIEFDGRSLAPLLRR